MQFDDYQITAARTSKYEYQRNRKRLSAAALGLAGEAGEVCSLVNKHVTHGREFDPLALCMELGDLLWYVAELASAAGVSLDLVAHWNLDKLAARYPRGYSDAASAARADEAVGVAGAGDAAREVPA